MGQINSQRIVFQDELKETMTGSLVEIGSLVDDAFWITFDNQSADSAVEIYVNGSSTPWKTFTAGEMLVIDVDTNRGSAPSRICDKGTTFFGDGASGDFSISYLTTKP